MQLFCCTPGDLGPAQGSDGVYRGSHLLVAGALRQALANTAAAATVNENLPWSALNVSLKNASELYAANHALIASSSTKTHQSGNSSSEINRPLAGLLEQPPMNNGTLVLIHGAMVHGMMRCSKSIPAGSPTASSTSTSASSSGSKTWPRVIMHAKV